MEKRTERILIVARMRAPAERAEVARLFDESDRGTPLPELGGVVSRSLFAFRDLYFQYMEVDQPAGRTMANVRDRAEFQELSRNLTRFIEPYDPTTWRSPRDAMATEFYRYEPERRPV
ncbi:TcmI family type II polyketide cyclase [Spongiactinospora sp. TRM90649]|uniref:TcmI family type II polyketide cyclase n=1 Tax=Spongiactinospora sp. TRM90649 TaxID=3031114 RepID=UPI0023FA0343|nr:TcmI family type II polyketide cyclase [Spongiactinospora sp. TRM90649]MDF5753656.1 TcmI family type II polyketide cyclase [Spongiactinospora sp. TRM90649]